MEPEVIVIITTLITICIFAALLRAVYIKGFKAGATRVLKEWKDTMGKGEEDYNE